MLGDEVSIERSGRCIAGWSTGSGDLDHPERGRDRNGVVEAVVYVDAQARVAGGCERVGGQYRAICRRADQDGTPMPPAVG